MTLVSLCMIMKNEEDELPLVIASAAGLADEIVIYDTGSTDRSVVLARELGATVVEGYWDDDFSRARNERSSTASATGSSGSTPTRRSTVTWRPFAPGSDGSRPVTAYLVPIESLEGGGLGVRSAFHAVRVFRRETLSLERPPARAGRVPPTATPTQSRPSARSCGSSIVDTRA